MNPHAANSLSASPAPVLSTRGLHFARYAWLVLALFAAGLFLTALPGYFLSFRLMLHLQPDAALNAGTAALAATSALASIAAALISFGLSGLLFRRKWDEPMGLFLAFYLLGYSIIMAGPLEMWCAFWLGLSDYAIPAQAALMTTPTLALAALFPNGRFVPAWMRWVVLLSTAWMGLFLWIQPGMALVASRPTMLLFALYALSIPIAAMVAQLYRYRYASTPEERQQTKWVVLGFGLWFLYIILSTGPYLYTRSLPDGAPLPWWALLTSLGWWLSMTFLPLSLTVAIMRYRLWDLDVLLNRAIVYGTLTACAVGLYVLVVSVLGLLFHAQASGIVPVIATVLIAVLLQPLRARLQRRVNLLLYGQRDEPFEVIAQVGQRLESALPPGVVLRTTVETIANAMKLPYVAIATCRDGDFVTTDSYGKPTRDPVSFPLVHQGEEVGRLLVARRAPAEPFAPADERLLRNIARQAAAAVGSLRLMDDLQRSRERLVTAREEERRRLRRDLHDGVGPTLAAHMLAIGAARAMLERDPAAAGRALGKLEDDMEATLGEIRRLVYALRPPALDQLGLVGAIRACAAEFSGSCLTITVDADEALPPLPAAIEVAAYHITREALTNATRHSEASRCTVRLARRDALELVVRDNGVGLPAAYVAGVGILSMRERAAELGGACIIKAAVGGGTELHLSLPLPAETDCP